jgi:D-alanine-D-alanine ligase
MSGGAITGAGGRRLRVAVLAGGRSGEHEISLLSGASVRAGLEAAGHEAVAVEIGRDGVWRLRGEPLALAPAGGLAGADVVFPALHGPNGEDGTVQGALEVLAVPYVGSGVAASALCLDKVLFKRLMATCGVPQVRYAGIRRERWERVPGEVRAELSALGLPVFAKPARMGSSVGIGRAASAEELDAAIDAAFVHDELVIVEAAASGTEVECGVLGTLGRERDQGGAAAIASEPGEIVLPGGWYDYAAKYEPGGMELRVPAQIAPVAAERVRELALRAFAEAGCEGLARVDFFVDGEEVLVNELNTMPGFTATSVYAKLLASSGIDYPELVDRLCRLALERQARLQAAAAGVGAAT